MIQKVLNEVKFHLNPNKPTKIQALDAIKLLVEKQVIPIARAQMKVRIVLSRKAHSKVYDDEINPLIDHVEDESKDAKKFEVVGIIDPINYKKITEILTGEGAKVGQGEGSIEVLDMAAVKE